LDKGTIIRWILLLLLGLALHEISNVIAYINPDAENIYPEHLYLDRNYKQPKISVLYFFYELTPYIDNVIKSIISYKMAALISYKLSKVFLVFIGLYVTQIWFYVYDRNTSLFANYCLYTAICLICLSIILPDKEMGRYRKFDEDDNLL
jgi:hypothetical protein